MMSQNLSAMYEHAKKQSTNAGTQDPVVPPKPFDPNAPKPSAFGGGSAFGVVIESTHIVEPVFPIQAYVSRSLSVHAF